MKAISLYLLLCPTLLTPGIAMAAEAYIATSPENPRAIVTEDRARITAAAFTPDGSALAAGLALSRLRIGNPDSYGLRVLDLHSGLPRVEFPVHLAEVSSLLFSPDGATLVSQCK